MADSKVSALASLPSFDGSEEIYVPKSGTSYKSTVAELKQYSDTTSIINTDSPYTSSYGEFIFADTSSGDITVNLPASAANGSSINIRHVLGSTGTLTIDGDGSEEIEDSVSSQTTKTLSVGNSGTFKPDGTKFHLI